MAPLKKTQDIIRRAHSNRLLPEFSSSTLQKSLTKSKCLIYSGMGRDTCVPNPEENLLAVCKQFGDHVEKELIQQFAYYYF